MGEWKLIPSDTRKFIWKYRLARGLFRKGYAAAISSSVSEKHIERDLANYIWAVYLERGDLADE